MLPDNLGKRRLKFEKTFEIEAKNQSDKNVYIERIELNGKPFEGYKLKHEDIMKGGKLVFFMNYKLKK